MKCAIVILNDVEKLEDFLFQLESHEIYGATIFQSAGITHHIKERNNKSSFVDLMVTLRRVIGSEAVESNTVLCLVKAEQIAIIRDIVAELFDDFKEPNTGIFFSLPVDEIIGGSFQSIDEGDLDV